MLGLVLVGAQPAAGAALSNDLVRVELDQRGLRALTDLGLRVSWQLDRDEFALTIDGTRYESRTLPSPSLDVGDGRATYTWRAGAYRVGVVYEVKPGWRFVSKQLFITTPGTKTFRVDAITLFDVRFADAVRSTYTPGPARQNLGLGTYGAFLRFDGGRGLVATAQNPFLGITQDEHSLGLRYEPVMDWAPAHGAFPSDRGILAPYRPGGRRFPAAMVPEWVMKAPDTEAGMDEAEVAAFTDVVRAFLLYEPERPLDIFVAWCVNDYQIDIATADGRAEYRRLFDRASALGAEHVLFAPTNSDLGRREDSVDDWKWENLLWLGLGQRLRRNEWDPRTTEVPGTVREMLDYAAARQLKLVAYVYPVLAFAQDPSWLVTRRNTRDGKQYASLGHRRFQDWLIDTLVAFHARTGISGYAFDHTFLVFDGPSSYAQWWGWRRVMETLRQRIPNIVIDGRQAYHLYGPWGWLAGSYPHPTFNDEQPESFVPFPDLSFDRVSAARQRFTAWRYRVHDFAPNEIVPGFITHQTPRNDHTGEMPQTKTDTGVLLDRFRARDWDYLGWRYSLLSSIATGGWNNVLNMIPGRDLEEHAHFAEADQAWFRRWVDWTNEHKEYLRHTRAILDQPALGKVDGTSAVIGNRGFVFLFNPNARRLRAELTLDASIGLQGAGPYVLRERYPLEGRLLGKPGAGAWAAGDTVAVEMDGQSALVLEVEPVEASNAPVLFNAPGSVTLSGGVLSLSDVRGEVGTSADLLALVPAGQSVTAVRVNGRDLPFSQAVPGTVVVPARFDGASFHHAQQVGAYDPSFAGGTFKATFTVPRRVIDQLEARQRAWPIPWTPDDYEVPWLAPHRLLLYVQLAEPDDRWSAQLRIDGRAVELKKAYTALWPYRRSFVGFYADVSLISPDVEHTVELDLPPLAPGQFQGLFFQNVETEYTTVIGAR